MNWFLAKLAFRIISGEGKHAPQFDEQLRLVWADNPHQAAAKARHLGQQEQESFLNQRGQRVQWQFLDLVELRSVGALEDGQELYSRIVEPDNADQYLHWVRLKAPDLESAPLTYEVHDELKIA